MMRRTAWLITIAAALLIPALAWNLSLHAAGQDDSREKTAIGHVPSNTGYLSASERHKIKLAKGELANDIAARGGRVVGDYGDSVVMEVSTAAAKKLIDNQAVQLRDEDNLIRLNAGAIDTTTTRGVELQSVTAAAPKGEKLMHMVQFAGPVKPEWYEALAATGAEIVTYIPSNAYLVYGNNASIRRIKALARTASSFIQWEGTYADVYRIDPRILLDQETKDKQRAESLRTESLKEPRGGDDGLFAVQLVKDPAANGSTLSLINQIKTQSIKVQWEILKYVNLVVGLKDSDVKTLSARPDVVSVMQYLVPRKLDERQNMIISGNLTGGDLPVTGLSWLIYLGNKGFTQAQFTGSNFLVNISDSGIDNANPANPNHFAYHLSGDLTQASRLVYARLEGTPNGGSTIQGCDGHGTENGSIIMGYVASGMVGGVNFSVAPHVDASGFHYGLGVCPFVKLGSSVIFDPDSFTFPNYANLESEAYNAGARVSSNSWGAPVGGAYNVDSQSYDALVRDAQPAGSTFPTAGNQEYTIVFAAGNNGSGANTVGSPGTAKNIITAGASENVQAFGGSDGCGVPDTGADHGFDVIGFSSRGPCDDGRKKPDLMAPGTHVSGVVAQSAAVATGTGSANACFDGGGVCGGVGSNFFPSAGQQFYTASSGTSHSTPAIAGACALVRQFWLNTFGTAPSPAMTKGALIHTATYMTGVGANDNLWSNSQGMGLMNIDRLFTTIAGPAILRDEVAADLFTASGQTRIFTGTVSDITKPFRVTLAWTDVPGPTSGNAFVNNLDLEVTVGGNTYKGNVFTGANSATGGTADAADNVESVFLPAGVSGPFVVTVKATNIAGDGVPGNGSPLDQDFALLVCNASPSGGATPVVTSAGATLVSESCTPANGVLDPNETVTVSFCVQNVGNANTTALMGTLQNTGGVTGASGAQNYGVVVAGGPAVCRNFTFTATGTCGGTVTATIHFQDGATDLGNVTYTFTLGTQSTAFSENFDGVTAPALPAGWVTAFTNGDGDCTVGGPLCTLGTNWTTVSGSSDTAPNHAFHNDPSCVTDSTLDTPSIAIPASAAQLTFRNFYNTESTFDGGVLEISINGGAFTDIITAGGSFVAGGYNGTISVNFLSPIAGRMAWTGNSGGFVTTTVNLPASAQGQPIKLRFRMASDCSVSATGWNIDTIKITGGFVCATCPAGTPCVLTCPANITKSNDPNQCGAVVTYPAPTSTGTCGTITCTPASGSFFPVGTTTVTCQASSSGGGSLPPHKDAPTACSTITESSSQAITNLNSVSCNDGFGHTDNSYWRAFTLSSFGISGAWDIQSVDIGIEEASAGSGAQPSGGKSGLSKSTGHVSKGGVKAPAATQPITVRLWTSSMPFPTGYPGSLTMIGQTNTTLADQADTIVNIPVTGTAPAGSQLVVEVFTPDGTAVGNLIFIGSNASPETGPSYLSAPDCGITTPTTTAAIGFPNMHIVMNVNGCTQAVGTGPTCTFTVTVNDTQPPVITCPAPIFVAAVASCPPAGGRTVNFTVTASDNCPGVTVVCTPPSGSVFPVGTTTVNCTATDAHGNTASCSFTVTVFTACLVDESNPGNVVLFNVQTGQYRFCCSGQLLASGTGTLTLRGCIGTIDDLKGSRKVHIEFDFSASNGGGKGTASLFLNGSTNPICKITDQNMANNSCTCPTGGPPAAVKN